jgi:hypothetical protein
MSHALHTPNMYLYMWTVVWRLKKVKAKILCNQPPVWFSPQLNAGLELFGHGHGHLATLYMGGGGRADKFARAF